MAKRSFINFLGFIFSILGLTAIFSPFYSYRSSQYIKADNDFTKLTAYLINDPQYLRTSSSKSSRKILRLQLDGYPGISFDNADEFLDITDYKAVLNDIKSNDTVTITILKEDFEKAYLNRNDYPVFEQIFNRRDWFTFYSLIFQNKNYVDLSHIFESANKRKMRAILVNGLFGGIFLVNGILLLFKWQSRKTK